MTTFLFTDIEGSTQKWEKHGEAMRDVLSRHDAILNEVITAYGGAVVSHTGDGVFAAFESGDPLSCCWAIQRRFQTESFAPVGEVRVRCAIHTGTAEKRGANYFGADVNLVARVLSAGHGGQILLTGSAAILPLPAGAELRDLGHHQLKDIFQPVHVLELMHPGLRLKEFPALKTLSNRPNNLPRQATPFFGRETELEAIDRMLADPACRLITLLGPGGMGKSRLSLAAAAEALDRFAQGVWFVALAGLDDPEQLTARIAESLRLNLAPQGDPKFQLFGFLREKRVLLVMDNFEHLCAGSGLLDEILVECPDVKILCSSRERLCLGSETVMEIHGLDYPRERDIEAFGAVKLFLDHAKRVKPGYALTPEDSVQLVKLCRLLDGMPLGLELAAAWVRAIPLPRIVERVETNITFLASNRKDLPERHRSIRAVFDYSWNLLSEEERKVLSGLSVFKGGFELDAAERVAGADPMVLAALVDKSQVKVSETGRFAVHELIRQFVREFLIGAGEEQRVLAAHSAYYCAFLHSLAQAIEFAEPTGMAALGTELDNVRQAWIFAVEHAVVDDIRIGVHALGMFLQIKGLLAEGLDLVERARTMLEATENGTETLAYAAVQMYWLALKHTLGQSSDLTRVSESCMVLLRRLNARKELATVLSNTTITAPARGKTVHHADIDEALRIFIELDDRNGQAECMKNSGTIHVSDGKLAEAQVLFEKALEIYQEVGNQRQAAWTRESLAQACAKRGDPVGAMRHRREAISFFESVHDLNSMAWCISSTGFEYFLQGKNAEALPHTLRSLAIFRDIGNQLGIRIDMHNLTTQHFMAGDLDEAADGLIQDNIDLAQRVAHQANRGGFYQNAAELAMLVGRLDQAEELIRKAEVCDNEVNDPIGRGDCFDILGEIRQLRGDLPAARGFVENALVLYCDKSRPDEAHARLRLGDILTAQGEPVSAQREYDIVLGLSREAGDQDYVLGALIREALRLRRIGGTREALEIASFVKYRSRRSSLGVIDFRSLRQTVRLADEILADPDTQTGLQSAREWAENAGYEQAFLRITSPNHLPR